MKIFFVFTFGVFFFFLFGKTEWTMVLYQMQHHTNNNDNKYNVKTNNVSCMVHHVSYIRTLYRIKSAPIYIFLNEMGFCLFGNGIDHCLLFWLLCMKYDVLYFNVRIWSEKLFSAIKWNTLSIRSTIWLNIGKFKKRTHFIWTIFYFK